MSCMYGSTGYLTACLDQQGTCLHVWINWMYIFIPRLTSYLNDLWHTGTVHATSTTTIVHGHWTDLVVDSQLIEYINLFSLQ